MHRYHLAGPRTTKYHFVKKIRDVDCVVRCQLFTFQLRQAKCGYLVWIPKMRNHQLFLRKRQEARFAHIQGNWKSSKAIHLRTSSDFGRPSQTSHPMCTLHPIWWRAILINPSSPSKYWSILQNLQIRFNLQICHPNQGLDDRKFPVSENSSLHILHNSMWVSHLWQVRWFPVWAYPRRHNKNL